MGMGASSKDNKTYLTVLLETFRLFAFTSHVVGRGGTGYDDCRLLGVSNARLEGVGILSSSFLDGLVSRCTRRRCISTIVTVTPVAKAFGRKAFTVQLEAFGLFTIASRLLGFFATASAVV